LCEPRTVKNKGTNANSNHTTGCEGEYDFAEHAGEASEAFDIAESSEEKKRMRETAGICNTQEIGYVPEI
jgi:hypothetical protein